MRKYLAKLHADATGGHPDDVDLDDTKTLEQASRSFIHNFYDLGGGDADQCADNHIQYDLLKGDRVATA
ncbi:hypothetical protein LTS15_011033 [Exophiala xenobiotica]|nr:hypothetical protein LTS15_011033 [Exophiala xenobiotica]